MKVTWRQLPTVLFEDEVLDKAFSRARKAADRVEDPNRVFRTRKQMTRMVQTAADIIHTMLTETVQTWPSLDQSPQFDVAMIEACVGTDDYRHHLSMLQWGASQVQRIATQNNRKIIRTARIELMHEAILQVRAKGIPTGILSNTCRSHWDWINCLPSRAMLDGFDAYVLSYEVGEMKPFGAIYEAAEQAAEVPSNQILFLDDRLENIQAAQARGWRAECCFGGVEAREVLVNYGFMLDRN